MATLKPKKQHVALAAIQFDHSTQARVGNHSETVTDYAELMAAGVLFPAPDVFQDGKKFWIGDGWHRLTAAKQNGDTTFPCLVHQGARQDAIKFALGANSQHGLKRSQEDKRRAAEMALREFPDLSDRELGKICALDHKTIAARRQVGNFPTSTKRTGGDGKSYPATQPEKAATTEPTSGAPTWDPESGTPKPAWVEAQERSDATKNDTFDLPAGNTETAPPAAAPITPSPVAPNQPSFDAAGWKANAEAAMRNWLSQVPQNMREKAAIWIGDTARHLVNPGDAS